MVAEESFQPSGGKLPIPPAERRYDRAVGTCRTLVFALALMAPVTPAAIHRFELRGTILPPASFSVSLHSSASPFTKSLLTGSDGRFRLREVPAGTYTLAVFAPGKGELRRTVEIGPGTANRHRRVEVTLNVDANPAALAEGGGHTVSVAQLSVSDSARRDYEKAQQELAKPDIPRAIEHLKSAVAKSPGFTAAWNNLGTIAYQTRNYSEAETYFREALRQDASSFAPLVNLGGVLLTLGKLEEAWKYNLYAVLARPGDALANSQLGMTYFALNNNPLAIKYLNQAKRIDPVHFSFPQLTLAEIYLRMENTTAAAAELEEFLHYHPDAANAGRVRELLRLLRQKRQPSAGGAGPAQSRDGQ